MYTICSYQIANTINIKAVRNSFAGTLIYSDSDELFYEVNETEFVYVFQFGLCCFFNFDEEKIQKILDQFRDLTRNPLERPLTEKYVVKIVRGVYQLTHTSLTLPEFDREQIRMAMLHTSQSVALDRYALLTDALLEEAGAHTRSLEVNGRLGISKSRLKRLIGKNLVLKNSIVENLYIFDTPDSTWESAELARLDADLKRTFDLKLRYRNIQERIDIIKENLSLFKEIWDHKESSTLEWIIIILILVEVIDLFVGKLL